MIIEDASHRRKPTLDLLNEFGPLVARGSYFIVEDTVLHNGATNPTFFDPGAHASVDDFLYGGDGGGSAVSGGAGAGAGAGGGGGVGVGGDFVSDRYQERFLFTWNPMGFLKRVRGDGWGDKERRTEAEAAALGGGGGGDGEDEVRSDAWVDAVALTQAATR